MNHILMNFCLGYMWTMSKFRLRISGGNEDKIEELFGIAEEIVAGMKTKVSTNKAELCMVEVVAIGDIVEDARNDDTLSLSDKELIVECLGANFFESVTEDIKDVVNRVDANQRAPPRNGYSSSLLLLRIYPSIDGFNFRYLIYQLTLFFRSTDQHHYGFEIGQ